MQWVRSFCYVAFMIVTILFFGSAIVLSFWLPFRVRYGITSRWARWQMWALKVLCGIDYRIEGLEYLPTGAYVTLWRHSSTWETIAQQWLFPPQAWVLKRELMWIPVFGWATYLLEPIAINRSAGHAAMRQVLEQGRQRLAAGRGVIIYPEGTRLAPGQRGKYGMSGALLATGSGCPVVPVAHNAGCFWPRSGVLKRPGTIRVIIGPPIETKGRDPREVNELARAWIEAKVAEIGG